MRLLLIVTMAMMLVTACSNIPVVDNSARMPASVRIETVSLSGGLGYFAFAGRQTSWTQGARRRVEQDVDFTESALGAFGAGAQRAYIFDLNSPRLRQVDYDSGQFHECDLLGCFEYGGRSRSVQSQPPVIDGAGCGLTIQESHVTLTPDTVRDSTESGMPHYFEWRIDYRDSQQRAGASRLHGILWLAPVESPGARAEESRFWQHYGEVTGLRWAGLQPLVAWAPLALHQRYFLDTLKSTEQDKATAAIAQLAENETALAGSLEWEITGTACDQQLPQWQRERQARAAAPETSDSAADPSEAPADGIESAGDFLSAIAAELSGKDDGESPPESVSTKTGVEKHGKARHVFTYAWQVKTLNWGQVSANQLSVPEGFEQGTRF